MKKVIKIKEVITLTKNKTRWISVIIVVFLFVLALCILSPYFADERVSSCVGNRGERSGNIYDSALTQVFVPSGIDLAYMELRFANCEYNEGNVNVTILNSKKKEVYSKTVPVSELTSDEYYRFDLDLRVTPKAKYIIQVKADSMTPNHAPRLWVSNNIADELGKVDYWGKDPDVKMQITAEFGYSQFHYFAFFVSLISILLAGFSALVVLKISERLRRIIAFFVLLLMPVVTFLLVELLNANSIMMKVVAAYVVNYILYLAIYCIFFAITNKLRFTVLFSNTIIFIIGVINFYKLEFRGEPVLLSDIVTLKTAMNVASEYEISLRYQVILTACLFMLVTAIVSRFRYSMRKKRSRLALVAVSLVFGTMTVLALFDTDRYSATENSIMKRLGIVNNVWNQPLNFSDNGMLVALTMNAQYLTVNPPEVYSIKDLNHIKEDIESNYGTDMLTGDKLGEYSRRAVLQGERPNIIAIMDESYSDFSQFDNIDLSKPYSPYMNSMYKNTIKGECYVSTYGGGTANSEFEFLTGNTMLGMPNGSIPYQQYISEDAGSLARVLKNYGYTTYAVHPYLASGWNRPEVYENMGFDAFYSQDDFEEPHYIRSYISDECSFDKLIELYEDHNKSSDDPLFLFNVTMQNHGSYTKSYANFEPDVEYVNAPGTYTQAEQYFSVARNTDDAVKGLISYFSEVEEPTVICFFGDHLPSLKDGFYEMLYGVKDVTELTPEQMQKMYITDFFIWANYDIPEEEIEALSLNYLSTLLMQVAGLPMTEYQMFLSDMYTLYPVITTMGINDKDGKYLGGINVIEKDFWNYYNVLEYNNVFGKDEREDLIFDYPYYAVRKFELSQTVSDTSDT